MAVARMLISLGMTINFVNNNGNTALDYAVVNERFEMADNTIRHVTGPYSTQKHQRLTGTERIQTRIPIETFFGGIMLGR